MRKPRDYAADLKALNEKARQLQERKVRELGQLVIATGADTLEIELLAGALLAAATNTDLATREEWSKDGTGFFQNARRKPGAGDHQDPSRADANCGGAASPGSNARAP